MDGLKRLATIADPPVHAQDPAGQSAPVKLFDAPGPDDVDPLTTACFKLAMFDTSFMYGIIRDGPRDFIRKDAEAAARAGAGWTQVLRGEGQSLDALFIGYAAGNPLSGPLWSRHGFRPLRSHWSMPLSELARAAGTRAGAPFDQAWAGRTHEAYEISTDAAISNARWRAAVSLPRTLTSYSVPFTVTR